jgi:hypothetical protein
MSKFHCCVTAELGLHGVSFDLKWNFDLYYIHLQNNFTVTVTHCWELRNISHRIIEQIKKDFFDCGPPQWFETLQRIFFPELIQMMVWTPLLHHIPHQWAERCEKIQNIPKEVHSAVDSFVEIIANPPSSGLIVFRALWREMVDTSETIDLQQVHDLIRSCNVIDNAMS